LYEQIFCAKRHHKAPKAGDNLPSGGLKWFDVEAERGSVRGVPQLPEGDCHSQDNNYETNQSQLQNNVRDNNAITDPGRDYDRLPGIEKKEFS